MRSITLYGRDGCHLCDEAREALERVRRDVAFDLQEIDIDGDERLQRMYFERIPVVALDGRELFDFIVDEKTLRRELSGANHYSQKR